MYSALWVRFTFCASRPSLGAKSGLADDFPQKFFHLTPPRNGNVGRVPETFQNPVFLVNANSQPQKKIAGEISEKIRTTFWEHDYFPLLKLNYYFLFRICH
jgi:hypothetical protein